jgi:hypothetical protein
MEYYSALKKEGNTDTAMTWMDLESRHKMTSVILHLSKVPKTAKFIKTENDMEVYQGEGIMGRWWTGMMVAQQCECTCATDLYTYSGKMVHVMYILPQ